MGGSSRVSCLRAKVTRWAPLSVIGECVSQFRPPPHSPHPGGLPDRQDLPRLERRRLLDPGPDAVRTAAPETGRLKREPLRRWRFPDRKVALLRGPQPVGGRRWDDRRLVTGSSLNPEV